MKILNLYAGVGGNRKLWGDSHEITSVEINEDIATVYANFFPDDELVIGDATEYLLQNFQDFDFIWSSPPCQSHSGTNHFLKGLGVYRMPDMTLYQHIIFLANFFKGKWVVENVKPYYEPLIPAQVSGRHYFWANFKIPYLKYNTPDIGTMNPLASKSAQRKAIIREAQIPEFLELHGLKDFSVPNKRQVLRNCVLPEVGRAILDAAEGIYNSKTEQKTLFE